MSRKDRVYVLWVENSANPRERQHRIAPEKRWSKHGTPLNDFWR